MKFIVSYFKSNIFLIFIIIILSLFSIFTTQHKFLINTDSYEIMNFVSSPYNNRIEIAKDLYSPLPAYNRFGYIFFLKSNLALFQNYINDNFYKRFQVIQYIQYFIYILSVLIIYIYSSKYLNKYLALIPTVFYLTNASVLFQIHSILNDVPTILCLLLSISTLVFRKIFKVNSALHFTLVYLFLSLAVFLRQEYILLLIPFLYLEGKLYNKNLSFSHILVRFIISIIPTMLSYMYMLDKQYSNYLFDNIIDHNIYPYILGILLIMIISIIWKKLEILIYKYDLSQYLPIISLTLLFFIPFTRLDNIQFTIEYNFQYIGIYLLGLLGIMIHSFILKSSYSYKINYISVFAYIILIIYSLFYRTGYFQHIVIYMVPFCIIWIENLMYITRKYPDKLKYIVLMLLTLITSYQYITYYRYFSSFKIDHIQLMNMNINEIIEYESSKDLKRISIFSVFPQATKAILNIDSYDLTYLSKYLEYNNFKQEGNKNQIYLISELNGIQLELLSKYNYKLDQKFELKGIDNDNYHDSLSDKKSEIYFFVYKKL